MASMIRTGMVVQWPDTHIPDHHRGAVKSLTRFIHDTQPALVLLTGDFFDCVSTARWSAGTVEEDGRLFKRELESGKAILDDIRSQFPNRMAWIPGNHEERLVKWGRTRGRGLMGITGFDIPSLAGFEDYEIECPVGTLEPSGPWEFTPGVYGIHGTTVRQRAGYTVHAEMEKFGKSIVMGHTHRQGLVFRRSHARSTFGIEGGHLMDQKRAGYLSYGNADWQMGFSVIEVTSKGVTPQLIPMDRDGGFMFEGVAY